MVNIVREYTDKVSIIIPKRRGEDISALLESIDKSYFRHYEVIVVDEGLERSAQRNIGIRQATGEYLLILDSDQHVTPHLLSECVTLIRLGWVGVYIPEWIVTKGLFAYIRNWERQFYNATAVDCVRFVKRSGCPLFDETMSGPEDSAWDRQITGPKIISSNYILHYDNIGMLDFFKKKIYYSKSMRRFAELYPKDKVLNFWWRCFGVFLEHGKWRRFLSRPDLALAVLSIIAIRGIIYETCKRFNTSV